MTEQPQRPSRDEDEQEQQQHEHATLLISRMAALEQATRLYDLNNAAVVRIFEEIMATAKACHEQTGEVLHLRLSGFSFFVNRRLVRLDFNAYKKAELLKRLWNRVGMGGILLPPETSVADLQLFAKRWLDAIHDPSSQATLYAQDWGAVSVQREEGDDSAGPRIRAEVYLVRTYCALVVLLRQTVERFQRKQRLPILRVKRTLQVMIDHLDGYPGLLLALARRRDLHGDLAAHLVSTATLTMMFGRKLGIERQQLVALGMAALFHDLPKAGLNAPTLNGLEKPELMAEADQARVAQHWMGRVGQFIAISGLTDETLARTVTMYESQLEFSRSGLYGEDDKSPHSIISQLVRLVDFFDTAAWTRPGKVSMTGHEAMRATLARAGGQVTPLLRFFLRTFGIYPTGSAVRLRSGELAVVLEQSPLDDPLRPVVKVIADKRGKAIDGPTADLSSNPDYGVHSSVMMSELGVNPVAAFGSFE